MAGTGSAATILGIIGTGIAAVGTGVAVKQGLDAQGAQETAAKKQNTAQQTATAAALSTQRKAAIAEGAANMQTPDIAGILARASGPGKGLGSTMLTGPGGVDNSGLNLGKTTLLGA